MTIEDFLEQDALLYPDKVAVVCDGERVTYRNLYGKVLSRVEELEHSSYKKGQIVAVRTSQTIDFLVSYFALHKYGCVVAPLEKGMPDGLYNQIAGYLSSLEVPNGSADILYTTGTTGKSKGVIISHNTIVADAENLIDGQGFSHDLAFVINGPLNHLGSLSKVYPIILLGGTLIITDGLKNMNAFFEAFDYPARKFATFLVPASIRILIRFGSERLSSISDRIDFVETGAAAISHDDMLKLCQLLPASRLYNTYASTETGIISTYDFNDGRCLVGCLGTPMRHSQVTITEEGLIACKGGTLMTGYVGESELTAEVMRDGTVFTSDIGEIDSEGILRLVGRKDDVINVGGFKVSPEEVEDAALAFAAVSDCICVPVPHPVSGVALKLLVVTTGDEPLNKRSLARYLKTRLDSYKVPLQYEKVDSIRRTYNGKLDRKFYESVSSREENESRHPSLSAGNG